jgi:PEP-CTERM motif
MTVTWDGWLKTTTMLALLAAAPATAAVKVATYTGIVKSGVDSFGLFGAPGADLTGQAYTSRITYDPTRGADPRYYLSPTSFSGGEAFTPYAPDPWSSATLRIGSRVFAINPLRSGVGVSFDSRTGDLDIFYLNFWIDNIWSQLDFRSTRSPTLTTLGGNLARSELSRDSSIGFSFTHYQMDSNRDYVLNSMTLDLGDRAFVTITDVPEPTTWTMLVAGFGLVGAALRRRNQRYTSASHQG